MIVDENIAELICTLEYKIGNQTYNPNSYNGWTGEEGCGFKYPVSYCKNKIDLEEHKITKTKSKIEFIDPECIETMNALCHSEPSNVHCPMERSEISVFLGISQIL